MSGSVIVIGAFDGVHQGHQMVIGKAVERSRVLGVPSLVYTFDPPPRSYFQGVRILTSLKEKLALLEKLKVDHVLVAPFDEVYLSRPSFEFIHTLKDFNPLEIIVGSDFCFGKNREGDINLLKKHFNVRVIEKVCCTNGETISSTRIRELITVGHIKETITLLGHNI